MHQRGIPIFLKNIHKVTCLTPYKRICLQSPATVFFIYFHLPAIGGNLPPRLHLIDRPLASNMFGQAEVNVELLQGKYWIADCVFWQELLHSYDRLVDQTRRKGVPSFRTGQVNVARFCQNRLLLLLLLLLLVLLVLLLLVFLLGGWWWSWW